MSNLYTGYINTKDEYINLAEKAGITFQEGTTYAIQVQNAAWLREGTEGQGFLFNKNKGYNWTCKGDVLYIKTTFVGAVVNIAENSGFFLNSGTEDVSNKADIDLLNVIGHVAPEATSYFSQLAFPGQKIINLELGATGSEYVAPANGYFFLRKVTSGLNQFISLINRGQDVITPSTQQMSIRTFGTATGQALMVYIPAKRGDIINCHYIAGGVLDAFQFIYADGSI